MVKSPNEVWRDLGRIDRLISIEIQYDIMGYALQSTVIIIDWTAIWTQIGNILKMLVEVVCKLLGIDLSHTDYDWHSAIVIIYGTGYTYMLWAHSS